MQIVTLLKNDFKKEESRDIDREIALKMKIKQLDNIVYKRDQSTQIVHMLTKPQFFYDHTTKQALGFQNLFYLKKAQQFEPKLYDGSVNKSTSVIVIIDSKKTLMLAEESCSKMLLKQQDPMVLEKKVNITPVDYAAVDQHRLESKTFEIKMNQVLNENEQVLEQVINKDIMNIVVNSSVNNASVDVHESQSQEKDMVITKLKGRIKSLNGNVNKDKEKGLIIATLKDELRKFKGKVLVNNVVTPHTIAPETLKIDVEPIAPRLLNNRTVHSDYLRRTQEQATILREVVEHGKSQNPLNNSLDHALKPSTSASRSQPSGNTKKDKIQRPPSSTQKNKVEAHPRTVKSSLKNKNCVVEPKGTVIVQHFKLNANSELICVNCNGCMLSDNHDLCVLNVINYMNARLKSKSVKKTSKRKVWKPTSKVIQIVFWYLDSSCSKHMTGDRSQLTNFIGNVMISRVYYVEGLGHNLLFVGQLGDSNLEVAFRHDTCFIRNLEGKDLLTGSRGNNLYTLSIGDMMVSLLYVSCQRPQILSVGYGTDVYLI
nr:integrase, catalytic region, zinc finger, CCHC-type, peptidase aspartic, catalytic [Tanacetum cinerariifolium]